MIRKWFNTMLQPLHTNVIPYLNCIHRFVIYYWWITTCYQSVFVYTIFPEENLVIFRLFKEVKGVQLPLWSVHSLWNEGVFDSIPSKRYDNQPYSVHEIRISEYLCLTATEVKTGLGVVSAKLVIRTDTVSVYSLAGRLKELTFNLTVYLNI